MKVFIGKAKDGKVDFESDYNKNALTMWLRENEGGLVRITCVKKRKVSDKLRGYYWGAVIPTIKQTVSNWRNENDDIVHDILKREFNGVDIFSPFTNSKVRVAKTIASRDAYGEEMMEFIEKIRLWLSENYGVDLPDPAQYELELIKRIDENWKL
jgi:hypothetical protein